jgi:hypothetical protein
MRERLLVCRDFSSHIYKAVGRGKGAANVRNGGIVGNPAADSIYVQ